MRWALPVLLVLAACGSRSTLLTVEVDTSKATQSRCITVVLRDPTTFVETVSPPLLKEETVRVAFAQVGLPDQVVVYAMGWADEACTTSPRPPERSEVQDFTFVKQRAQLVRLTVVPRPNAIDADGDGYFTKETGGDDCDDTQASVHPSAMESCSNGRDDDCDGLADCAQGVCGAKACGLGTGASCQGLTCVEGECLDGRDNDADGRIDCADSDCDGRACRNQGSCQSGICQATSEKDLCADGVDNDGDLQVDCADSDCAGGACFSGACTQGATCAGGACQGGQPVKCEQPPNGCFDQLGTCDVSDGGCQYAVAPGRTCNDGNACTSPDRCSDAGACSGPMVSCQSPSPCLKPTACAPGAGCQFVADPSATCDDGNPCTSSDVCRADGGCGGAPKSCPMPGACLVSLGCQTDGGCATGPGDAGVGCDAGTCNGGGHCVPTFPYRPSHFTEAQLPTPPAGIVELDCAAMIEIDSTDAGISGWCAGKPKPGIGSLALGDGREAMVLSFESLNVGSQVAMRFIGTRPVVVAALGNVNVLGTLDARAGAAACLDGGVGSSNGGSNSAGSGGGGYGSAGGDGFNQRRGGVVNGAAAVSPLRGGCPGGVASRAGGLGGGALQISAAGGLTITGRVGAPGGKGLGGRTGAGGSGAGSGGGLLLEAVQITLGPVAALTANGGSGGEGGGAGDGSDGTDGSLVSADPVPGGSGGFGGNGGQGAALNGDADTGENGGLGPGNGGGGGGVGRIRLRALNGCDLSPASAIRSPLPTSDRTDAGCQ